MRRSEYDQLPNRIIPPNVAAFFSESRRAEYERSSRILPAPSVRQPLLENPIDPYMQQSYAQPTITYNGPVIDPGARRRGFDKGPYGEDLAPTMMRRPEGRQPLIRNPKFAVEHVGGDMDISRSRSISPDVQIIRVTARSVRDDRRRERGDRNQSRRSRSRSRSRERSRGKPKDRDMARGDRTTSRDQYEPPISHDQIRDGIVHTGDNYYEFLDYYVASLNEKIQITLDRDVQGQKKVKEIVTDATEFEKDRIVLPPDFNNTDRERMLHCDTTITGLPVSIFYGSGYGPRAHYAKYSAAKDFVDKCHRIGIINSELHVAIGDWQRIDRTFKSEMSGQIAKAVNAVILLMKRMAIENLPSGFMTMRNLSTDLIDQFKTMLRMVMIDVYYQGMDTSATVVPNDIESAQSSRHRDSDMRRRNDVGHEAKEAKKGPSNEELLRLKEKELKEKMEKELEKKRVEMEQQIRQQVLEEERAKIRAEIEMEKKIETMKMQQQQYQIEKDKKVSEDQQKLLAMVKKVEDDFNAMVEQLEKRFIEVRSKGLNHVLDMIYGSETFKTIQLYSSTLTSLTYDQKQKLVQELRSLLESVSVAVAAAQSAMNPMMGNPMMGNQMMGNPIMANPVMSNPMMGNPMLGNQLLGNYPGITSSAYPITQQPQIALPLIPQQQSQHLSTSSVSRNDEVRRLTVGNMQLRALSSSEQRRLTKGNKVIAQDAKTGSWSLATVEKIRDNRVTLTVGNATWKKYIDELYKEDDGRPAY